jgi:mono/diheme cytochrome c family protein
MVSATGVIGLVVLAGCAAAEKREAAAPEPAARAAAPEDHVAGKAIYDANCASCHRLGSYDTEGKANLKSRVGQIDPGFLAHHHGGSLTPADVANLKSFVSAP